MMEEVYNLFKPILLILIILFECSSELQTSQKNYDSTMIEVFDGDGYSNKNLLLKKVIDYEIYINDYTIIFFDNLKNETIFVYQIIKISEECVKNEDITIYHLITTNKNGGNNKLALICFDDERKNEYIKFLMTFSEKKEKIVWKTSNLAINK